MMEFDQSLSRLAVALGIGLLIGLERGWKTREVVGGRRAAGVRTFALCGTLGGIVAALAQVVGTAVGAGLVLGLGFAVYATIFALLQRDADRAAGSFSATTTIAGLLTFALGAFAVAGDARIAAAVAVATAGILAARGEIHGWIARVTWPELRSALVLLAMTFIVLPVVPDTKIGPDGGVNPREVWLIAIVLAGVSFLGYAAVKWLGARRGVLLAAVAGGLVSSTAVTMTSARRAAAGEAAPVLLAAGVAVATAVSFIRVAAIIAVMQPSLLPLIGPALGAAAAVAVVYAVVTVRWRGGAGIEGVTKAPGEGGPVPSEVAFRNPFSFWPVVGFAIFLAIVIVLGRIIGETFGAGGALLGAAGLGLADVDSVTISLVRLVPAPLGPVSASVAILVAVASNMVSKLALAAGLGRGRFAAEVAAMTVACWLAGLTGLAAALGIGQLPH
ncbi:MAG: DUF4010 domain-containing protein [Rhodopseudomonas sp.]|nr:DUF4010 domain-containing protein [Rhodopseudomonas sp.]